MEMKALVFCMLVITQTLCETVNLLELRRESPDTLSLVIKSENVTELYKLSRKKGSHMKTLIADKDESLTLVNNTNNVSLA